MGGHAVSTIAPNDANIVYSPYNWDVTATQAKTINAGAYLRLTFTGAPTTLAATFDVTNMPASASRVGIRVDGGSWVDSNVAASIPLTIPAGTTWGSHTVELVMVSSTETANRWLTPQNTAVIFTGLTADTVITTRLTRKRNLYGLCLGDSIAEGVRTLNLNAATDPLRNDSRLAWAYPLSHLLGAEVGVVGFGATGISKSGNGNVPKFSANAPYLWDTKPRSLTTPQEPDFIVAHIGTNDSASTDAAVTTDTTALLNQWLAASTKATIFVLAGWLQTKAAPIQAGIAACSNPARVNYIDTTGWWSSADASDSLHPYGYVNTSDLAPRLAASIKAKLGGGTVAAATNTYRRGPDGSLVPA